jgi:hypothetical protein
LREGSIGARCRYCDRRSSRRRDWANLAAAACGVRCQGAGQSRYATGWAGRRTENCRCDCIIVAANAPRDSRSAIRHRANLGA